MPLLPPHSVTRLSAGLVELLDLALPDVCAGCDDGAGPLCPPCRRELRSQLFVRPRATMPDPVPPGLPPVVAAGPYVGVLRVLVSAYKDDERRDLRPLLAPLLAATLTRVVGPTHGRPPVLVPMPSSRAAVRRRGDDPVRDLTRAAARLVGGRGRAGPPVVSALTPVRRLADQSRLGHRERAANLAGAYAVRPRHAAALADVKVVLVDDVVTTGSTLAEAARAVRAAGGRVVGAATLAATRRETPSRGERQAVAGRFPGEP